MPTAKKNQKKSTALKKTVSKIKKVRSLEQEPLEFAAAAAPEAELIAKKAEPKRKPVVTGKFTPSRKGFLNSVCFQIGALFGDGNALLECGQKEE